MAWIIALGIGGGYAEVSFSCGAFGCTDEVGDGTVDKIHPFLEAIFGIPLLLSPAILGAAPAIVRSFLKRIDLRWSVGYSIASIVLSFLLYFAIGALLLIGIVRYVLDPSLFPEIVLFPLALVPLPWIVDRLIKAALGG